MRAIDDLVDAADRSRALRRAALSYQGNWCDILLFLCALLFTVIWWDDHHRSNWLAMFILLIVLPVVAAVYALRGVLGAASSFVRRQHA